MNRPLPKPTSDTQHFWDGCTQGELRYQQCSACQTVQLIPRAFCEHCKSRDLAWKVSSRQGTLLSFTKVHRAPLPVFQANTPYVIAMVDMAEGFRLMANVKDGATLDLRVDQPVRIGFVEVDGVQLPQVEVDA